jgi:hypothetical protein
MRDFPICPPSFREMYIRQKRRFTPHRCVKLRSTVFP